MNSDNQNTGTDNNSTSNSGAQAGEPGYHTSGQDKMLQSSSPAVSAPGETSEQRLTDPPSIIRSLGEKPGDANPALAETIGEEEGRVSTADLLLARETAEERPVLGRGLEAYEDQSAGARPQEFQDADSGRPNWPDDLSAEPTEYMQSPRANMPFGTGGSEYFDVNFKGRVDAEVDRSATQAEANASHSGLPAVGYDAAEDTYEQREFGRPEPPSDMDMIAPGMVNLAPEDDDDNG